MKVRVPKKLVFVLVPVLVLGAGAAGYYFFLKKDQPASTTNAVKEEEKDKKVDSVFTYLQNTELGFTKIAGFLSQAAIKDKVVPGEKGTPQAIIFAPSDAAFEKDDVGEFQPVGAADERVLYHAVLLYPAADGAAPSLDLTDGQRLTTLSGRDVLVKVKGKKTTLVDTKGRSATVGSPYYVDNSGHRIYTIDNVLLIQ